MSKKEAAKATEGVGDAPKSKKKLIIILVAVVVVLAAAGGGAAWFFLVKNQPAKDAKNKKKEAEMTAPAIFIPLERFTVNLVQENGDQVLQVGVSLKTYDPDLEEKIKKDTPEIRSRLLELLSSKRASQLSTVAGKKQLTAEILYLTNRILGFKKPIPLPERLPTPVPSPETAPAASSQATVGGLAGMVQQAQPKPEAPAVNNPVSVTEFLPDASFKGVEDDHEGVVDVLYTDFIIQ